MSNIKLEVYLFFKDGKCKEAMEFYKGVFGGDLEMNTYEKMGGAEMSGGHPEYIMHANLKGGAVELMASDSTGDKPFGRSPISISLAGEDETQMHDLYTKLSDGGTADYPMEKQSWGDIHGGLTDKYGFEWMFTVSDNGTAAMSDSTDAAQSDAA